jgi:hypothetical protein
MNKKLSLKKLLKWDESFFLVVLMVFVTIVFPNVVIHPTTVFGYGGGGGGGGNQNVVPNIVPDTVPVEIILSSTKVITNFEINGQKGSTTIDSDNIIRLTMPYGTDLSLLSPTFIFQGESIFPISGETLDFTRAQTYTVTAEDSSTKVYTVIVDLAPSPIVLDPMSEWFMNTVQKTDMVRDGKVDILDFNVLMVHWSDPSSDNVADLNHDESVDVFDFNILMVHWGSLEL